MRHVARWILVAVAAVLLANSVTVRAWGDPEEEEVLDLSEPRRELAPKKKRNCSTVAVPSCMTHVNRDIIFALDTSNSLNRALFYSFQLDFVESALCAFSQLDVTRAGLVTFSNNVVVRIPLAQYSVTQWFTRIENLRANNALCCAQGTPTAELFNRVKTVFTSNPTTNERITILLTDGEPYQVANNKKFAGSYPFPTYSMAKYMLDIVPKAAMALKTLSRLIVIGMPSGSGLSPRESYFKGIPDPALQAPCGGPANMQGYKWKPTSPLQCGLMNSTLFPIVSTPADDNWYNMTAVTQLDVLLSKIVPILCPITVAPTPSQPSLQPTPQTSLEPTSAPTAEPTLEPTPAPTLEPTSEPTLEPTVEPTLEPTVEPTVEPTLEPTVEPTVEPTLEPTVEPTLEPTPEPTVEPTLAPTKVPTLEPTTAAPTRQPTRQPTQPTPQPTTRSPTAQPTRAPTRPPTTRQPTHAPTCKLPGALCVNGFGRRRALSVLREVGARDSRELQADDGCCGDSRCQNFRCCIDDAFTVCDSNSECCNNNCDNDGTCD